ncbi:MAG: prepilin-type N-terminal cleavage/methylation domain-containing protein [Chthoniobacteraceae bacterium]
MFTPLTMRPQNGFINRAKKAFSLIELLVVITVMSILAALSAPAIVGLVSGNQLTNNIYQLSGMVQQARTLAITQNTYVLLGFYSYVNNGTQSVMVGMVSGKSGQLTDVLSGTTSSTNFLMVNNNATLKNVQIDTGTPPLYISPRPLPGVDTADNNNVTTSTNSFQIAVAGNSTATFTYAIAFGPDGTASLMQPNQSGALQPTRCIGIGLKPVSAPANSPQVAAIQISGLSGQVSVFQR